MKRLIEAARQFLNVRARAVVLVGLVGLTGWLLVANQPAYAAENAKRLTSETPQERNNNIAKSRMKDYEEALDVTNDPRGTQKEYRENLEELRRENSSADEGGLIEEAKDLVEKVLPGK